STHSAASEIFTLSLHDALPIWRGLPFQNRLVNLRFQRLGLVGSWTQPVQHGGGPSEIALGLCHSRLIRERVHVAWGDVENVVKRSEEHTSELQSLAYLVCRLLL